MTDQYPVVLREFTPADAPFLLGWIAGPGELLTWAGPTFIWPLDDCQLQAYAEETTTGARRTWTAVDPTTDEPLGHASLRFAGDGTARLGRVLVAPQARGRGIASMMLPEILAHAFGPLGLESLNLGVYEHNTGALGIYERLGFTTYEVLKDVEHVDGVPWTALQMRLSSQDWR